MSDQVKFSCQQNDADIELRLFFFSLSYCSKDATMNEVEHKQQKDITTVCY